jgi:hypothetical protein
MKKAARMILGSLFMVLVSCGTQPSVVQADKQIMTFEESLNYFNLKDVGEIKSLPQGKMFLTVQDLRTKSTLNTQSLSALSAKPDEGYQEIGNWYVPGGIYKDLQQERTPFGLSIDALNLLQGSELKFLFNASPDQMRSALKQLGLSVRDVRELSYQDGEISVEDLKQLASKADRSSAVAGLAAMGGLGFRATLEGRIAARQAGVQK